VLVSAALTRAVESARVGQYQDALASLEELGGRGSDDPRVVDLMARVHAQRGEFADADLCWARVEALDPGLQAAVVGRRRIAALQARRFRPRVLPVAVAVVAVVAGVGVLLPTSTPAPPAPPSPAPVDLSGLDAVESKQDQLARDLAALQASLAAPKERFDQLAGALTSPRFTVTRQGEAALVTFNDGLFSRDARLSAAGRAVLAELGRMLKPFPAEISVIGHGSTVELGLRRAQAAAGELAAVNLRSSTQLPFPPGSRRNNTVTVLIDPD
jgi:hypothetical protein